MGMLWNRQDSLSSSGSGRKISAVHHRRQRQDYAVRGSSPQTRTAQPTPVPPDQSTAGRDRAGSVLGYQGSQPQARHRREPIRSCARHSDGSMALQWNTGSLPKLLDRRLFSAGIHHFSNALHQNALFIAEAAINIRRRRWQRTSPLKTGQPQRRYSENRAGPGSDALPAVANITQMT